MSEWMTKLENFRSMSHLSGIIKADLVRMKQAIDLRDDLWKLGGYNIERADQGMFGGGETEQDIFLYPRLCDDHCHHTDGPRSHRGLPH